MTGTLITFEGIDGTGKSTQVAKLCSYLAEKGRRAVSVKFPGETDFGKQLRSMLFPEEGQCKLCSKAQVGLFLADFLQTQDEIVLPALQKGQIVVCDRYADSQFAYWTIEQQSRPLYQAYQDLAEPEPDLTFLLLMVPAEAYRRANQTRPAKKTQQQSKAWNSINRLSVVQSAYLQRLQPPRRVVPVWLDSNNNSDWVFEQQIKPAIDNLLFKFQYADEDAA